MVQIVVGAVVFAVALASWRIGLQNKNWLEGGFASLVVAVAAALLTDVVLRAMAVAAVGN